MAIGIKSFVALALAGFGLEYAYVTHGTGSRTRTPGDSIAVEIQKVRGQIRRESTRLRVIRFTEQLRRATESLDPRPLTVLSDSAVALKVRHFLETMAGSEDLERNQGADRISTIVYAIDARKLSRGFRPYRAYLLPVSATPRRCIVALTIRPNDRWSAGGGRRVNLGPCELMSRFGLPGREIGRWFNSEGGALTAMQWSPSPPGDRWRFRYSYAEPAEMSLQSCALGKAAGCSSLLEQRRALAGWLGWDHPGTYVVQRGAGILSALRPWSYLLYDLMEQFGPERFQRFWKSDLPLEQAFESVYGVKFTAWVSEWAARTVEKRPNGKPVLILLSLLAMGSLAGALVYTGRRQVPDSSD